MRSAIQTSSSAVKPLLLQSPLFTRFDTISHAFTTRQAGVSPPPFDSLNLSSKTGDSEDNVRENIAALRYAMSFDEYPLFLDQVHGSDILVVENGGKRSSCLPFDAVITGTQGIPLAVLTADCLSILLYDWRVNVIGVVHAGWRGTASGITKKTVLKMAESFGTKAENVVAAMGPAIGSCCYEVDDIVSGRFKQEGNWEEFATAAGNGDKGRWMLDLAKANLIQLLSAGVGSKNISLPEYCTGCRADLFYSHRRDGRMSGRQGAVLMIRQA